jgi:hypothetical protein
LFYLTGKLVMSLNMGAIDKAAGSVKGKMLSTAGS